MLINCFNKSSNKSNVRKKNSLASKNEDIKKKKSFHFPHPGRYVSFSFLFFSQILKYLKTLTGVE